MITNRRVNCSRMGGLYINLMEFMGWIGRLHLCILCIFLMSLQKLAESFVFLSHIQKRYGRTV